ncbi:TonB-dependent receptor [Acidithiobacillus thiooxidans]|jgi:iron complex outermembrane receptor protein|uniref:TonB-dependent receptor n=1 Tax=Acidithiobacillus thiooxidans TaxID=930 RepID=UPI001C0750DD|nr:TonB-dependent receptor [Acidithiobacillus thiooxidans]MBU2839898.1 TonB-dependent receptor [Acidithiobacillus thiooxidans]
MVIRWADFHFLWLLSGVFPLSIGFFSETAEAEDLGTVRREEAAVLPVQIGQSSTRSATVFRLDQKQVAALAGPGGANSEAALGFLPGVSYNAADALNLANVQSASKGLRVRGETVQHGAGDLLDGLPLVAGFSGPGQWLVDQEDIQSLQLFMGAVPPSLPSPGSLAGVVDSRILWPQAQTAWLFSQSVGSKGFSRSFLRWDSGALPGGSTLFLSGSFTRAGQWRGWGAAPEGRSNAAIGWQQPYASGLLRLFYVHADYRSSNYRPLNYRETLDLKRYGRLAYARNPASNPFSPEASLYQGYNHQRFTDNALLLEWRQHLGSYGSLHLSPYAMQESGAYWRGIVQNGQGLVQRADLNAWRWGLRLDWEKHSGVWDWRAGYWHDEKIPPHPLTNSALYQPTANGGLQFLRWSLLSAPGSPERYDSFYLQQSWHWGRLTMDWGGRYVWDTLPGLQAFDPRKLTTDVLDEALAQSALIARQSVRGRTLTAFLPYLGLRFLLREHWLLRASAGSNVASPGFDLWPAYQQNAAAFNRAGLQIQNLWNAQRLIRSNQGDMALRWASDAGYMEALGYYGTFQNKSISVYDALSGLTYPQNVGNGRSYGASLSSQWRFARNWSLTGNGSYTRSVFSQNVQGVGGTLLPVAGLQTPDTPRWSANAFLQYDSPQWRASVQERYLGPRWADSLHREPVPGYFLTDLNLGHTWNGPHQSLDVDLWVYNLLQNQGIGLINTGGITVDSGANFYPLPARTIALTLRWHYR